MLAVRRVCNAKPGIRSFHPFILQTGLWTNRHSYTAQWFGVGETDTGLITLSELLKKKKKEARLKCALTCWGEAVPGFRVKPVQTRITLIFKVTRCPRKRNVFILQMLTSAVNCLPALGCLLGTLKISAFMWHKVMKKNTHWAFKRLITGSLKKDKLCLVDWQ